MESPPTKFPEILQKERCPDSTYSWKNTTATVSHEFLPCSTHPPTFTPPPPPFILVTMADNSSSQRLSITRVLSKCQLEMKSLVPAACLLLSLFLGGALGSPRVPALFVFGDSLVDTGNSNYLTSLARSNYFPYGIDFTGGPSGRFSNGKTIVDMIGDLLGNPAPPAFADPTTVGTRLLDGSNYASAAAGILDQTGQHYGQRFTLNQQVLNFENNLSQLRMLMNATTLSQYLAKSLVIMVFGSNDYINNYLLPGLYASSYFYTPPAFANFLLNRYSRQILALHSLGLRKFFLAGIAPLGCIPNQRATGQAPPDRCVDKVNAMLGTFNEGLRTLVSQLNANHPGSIFVYGNTYGVVGDMLNNPATYGFNVIDRACCGIGRNQGQITCIPMAVPCANRNEYAFWDAFHPSQAATSVLARRAYSGPPQDCFPINILQMSLL